MQMLVLLVGQCGLKMRIILGSYIAIALRCCYTNWLIWVSCNVNIVTKKAETGCNKVKQQAWYYCVGIIRQLIEVGCRWGFIMIHISCKSYRFTSVCLGKFSMKLSVPWFLEAFIMHFDLLVKCFLYCIVFYFVWS